MLLRTSVTLFDRGTLVTNAMLTDAWLWPLIVSDAGTFGDPMAASSSAPAVRSGALESS